MNGIEKGRSPFFPGQPVPIELFIGRSDEIQKIARACRQVELGKQQMLFLTGEYGIGKSSLASYMRYFAEKENGLFGIHVMLGGAKTIPDIGARTVEAALKTPAYEPTISEKIRGTLAKYIGKQELFSLSINLEALKVDAPSLAAGYLPFLGKLLDRVKENGMKGVMLIIDEINGIAENADFAHFIKGMVDENALSRPPLPLMLLLCGVEERRRQMIRNHQPVERIFDIVQIEPMNEMEMKNFFITTFESAGVKVSDDAVPQLLHYSAGYPRIMHAIGEAVYWTDTDNVVTRHDAAIGITRAAQDIGQRYVDQQVYKALESADYRAILAKLAMADFDLEFVKGDIEKSLTPGEKNKFNNFLQRMKKLNVLRAGDEKGAYIFNSRLVRLYMRMMSQKDGR